MSANLERAIAAHYNKPDLLDAILAGLEASGADMSNLRPKDVAPVDEFHTAGRVTTLKALDMMQPVPGMRVLDAGCGIGGTARVLAREYGCTVTGLDLTPEYIDVARALTERMGLTGTCSYRLGSVTAMPFEDASFDAGVTFHVAMNVHDRAAFYGELARVLQPGATLCAFDVMKGPAPGMVYPVPWAETEATSFLRSPDETRSLLSDAGFAVIEQESLTDFAIGFFRKVFAEARQMPGPPPLGLHLLTGDNAPEKFANYAHALDAGQIEPMILIARRSR